MQKKIRALIREDIQDLIPYEPHPYSDVVKMDANENPHPFPTEVMAGIFSRMAGEVFTRYPDPLGDALRERIAGFTGTARENVVLGNGSDELIQLILQTFGGPGKRVVIPVPTFSMYKIHGQITGTIPVEVPRDQEFGLAPDLLLAEMKHPDTRVTFIATPNNPTGNAVPVGLLEELAGAVESLVVIDEAYIDFGGSDCLHLMKEHPNVIVLRTFSKVALAGLRIGYLLAQAEVVRELLKVKQPYNVNAFSQAAALAVLENWPLFRDQIAEISAERERLGAELGKIPGIRVYPSDANFLLFRVPAPAPEVHRKLLELGVLVRNSPGNTHGLEQCLRVTVGTEAENDLFLDRIKAILMTNG